MPATYLDRRARRRATPPTCELGWFFDTAELSVSLTGADCERRVVLAGRRVVLLGAGHALARGRRESVARRVRLDRERAERFDRSIRACAQAAVDEDPRDVVDRSVIAHHA